MSRFTLLCILLLAGALFSAAVSAEERGRDLLGPSTRSSPVLMDFDGDSKEDLLTGSVDVTILAQALDQPVSAESVPTDLNFDGFVVLADLCRFADLWLSEYGAVGK